MRMQAALVQEQGVTFVVAIVKPSALNAPNRDALRGSLSQRFGNVPAVLMAQDGRGTPTYYGRNDIVKFLSNVWVDQLPWRWWNIN